MMLREKIIRFCLLLLRLGMGGFFLFVAVRKLLHLDQLQETIDRFSIFPEAWGHPLACLGVSCEIAVGMGLLFRRTCPGLDQGAFPLVQLHRCGEGGNQLPL